jgi:AraC family transcriptional regulator of adaptative response / DNA-3-methyladenine glycosylase II
VAAVDPSVLARPATRRDTVLRLAEALAAGDVDLSPGADRAAARAALLALPGIGPWTVETVAMRALGDPDAFLPSDLGVKHAARDLGIDDVRRAVSPLGAVARLRRAAPVGHLRPRRQPPARGGRMTRRTHAVLDTPVGPLVAVVQDGDLVRLGPDPSPDPEVVGLRDDDALPALREQLDAYWAGTLQQFDLPLAPPGTPWQQQVWAALRTIPYGRPGPTASSPSTSAAPRPRARSARRTGATPCSWSCPATAWSAARGRSPATRAGST